MADVGLFGRESPLSSISKAESAAMLRAAFRLFELWQIDSRAARILLGQPSQTTFYRWRKGSVAKIPHDTAWRLGLLMGIHKGTRYLFPEAERSYAWIKKPNLAFNGQSALERMLAGAVEDLAFVRNYLDAERTA